MAEPVTPPRRVVPGVAWFARPWAWPLVWAAAAGAVCASTIGLEPNLVEEGLVLHFAQRLVAGEHIYRDMTFFTGPLPFELLALLFRVFGEEIMVGRWTMVAIHALAAATVFALGRRAGAGWMSHAAAAVMVALPLILFPFYTMFYYTPLCFYLGVYATYATLRGTEDNGWAFAAGLLIAAVALCKQTLGVALAVGLLAAALGCAASARRWVTARSLLAGGAVATLVTVGLYAGRGDLAALWEHLVVIPSTLTESYRSPFMNLWPVGKLSEEIRASQAIYLPNLYLLWYGIFVTPGRVMVTIFQILYALPLLTLAATLLMRAVRPLPAAVWCHAGLLLAMTANLFPRSDWGHLVIALPATIVHGVLLYGITRPLDLLDGRPLSYPEEVPRSVAARLPTHLPDALPRRLAALAVVLAAVWCVWWFAGWLHGMGGKLSWGPRIPLSPVSAATRSESLPRVIHYLRERVEPGEAIFVARAEPLVYFATDTVNPTRFSGVLTTLREEQEAEILAALDGVRFVVMSEIDQPLWTYYYEELPRVQRYLERHFEVAPFYKIDNDSWILVLTRREDRGETLIDLIDQLPAARRWLRDKEGALHDDAEPPRKMAARGNARALPMRVGLHGGGIDYRITVPKNAHFEAGVGMRFMNSLGGVHMHPYKSRMLVSVSQGNGFETLDDTRIEDHGYAGGRWVPIRIDLSELAGQSVTLRLELVPDERYYDPFLSWWAAPRIARTPGTGAGAAATDFP